MDLIVSPNDSRNYDVFTLANKMQVMIISDVETKISSACLQISVGWLDDPREYQGIAHFLEHMLFMGSEKYPGQNDYNQFITQNAGSANASTNLSATKYYFTISNEGFKQAIDIFAQFFICPLFDQSCVEREMNAVESEFNLSLAEDQSRLWEIFREVSNHQSTFHNFGCGNLSTLKKPDIRDQLIKFYNAHYCASLMKLVIYTNEPINQIKPLIQNTFSVVPNRNIPKPLHLDNPFYGQEAKLIRVQGVKQEDVLYVSFLTKNYREEYLTDPEAYVSHLLGHEGENTLASFLKDEGLITGLTSGNQELNDAFTEIYIELILTEDGLEQYEKVLGFIFKYLGILQNEGINKELYNEWAAIQKIDFKYKEKCSVCKYTSQIAQYMHDYPQHHILYGRFASEHFNAELILELFRSMNHENMKVFLRSQEFKENEDLNLVEPYCKTKYSINTININKIVKNCNSLLGELTDKKLGIFPFNRYIPKDFTLLEGHSDKPSLIAEDEMIKCYHYKENKFNVCKTAFGIEIYPEQGYVTQPKQKILMDLWMSIFQNYFEESIYDAECASIEFELALDYNRISVTSIGFSDSISQFYTDFIDYFIRFHRDPKQIVKKHIFGVLLDELDDRNENYFLKSPYDLTFSYFKCMLYKQGKYMKEQLTDIEVNFGDFLNFTKKIMSTMQIKLYFHGNISKEQCFCMYEVAKTQLHKLGKANKQIVPMEIIKLGEGMEIFQKQLDNIEEPNSGVIMYYQGEQSREIKYEYDLLNQILSDPLENQLRTNEQLGYVVYSNKSSRRMVYGINVTIISETKSPQQLRERIIVFLKEYVQQEFINLSLEEFNKHKESLKQEQSQDYQNMNEHFKDYWGEIKNNRFDFQIKQKLKENIEKIELEQFKQFGIDLFNKGHIMTVEVVNPKHSKEITNEQKLNTGVWFKDLCM